MKIGFIGLGIMGESMCENIVKKLDVEVLVYDISKEKVDNLVALGAKGASSIREIGENCDRIISMVPKSEHVKVVINELLLVIKPGTILIEMSTIDPIVSREVATQVKSKFCEMVDAPVVKSKPAAISGELGIYVGGDKEVFETVKPILQCMGKDIIHMGDNGSGLVMKICHNMLVAQIQNGVNEMLTLAEASGLNFDDAVTAISYGGGQNFYLDGKKATIKSEDFSPKFSVENMHKDIHLALNLAKEVNLNLPGAENAREIYDTAVEQGLSKEDFSSTIKVVKKIRKLI
jgi:3-hydroxyisobutyrate dehydrogenase-like beta-hydroxyacid dehydrogenase